MSWSDSLELVVKPGSRSELTASLGPSKLSNTLAVCAMKPTLQLFQEGTLGQVLYNIASLNSKLQG